MNENPFFCLAPIDRIERFYNRRSEVRNALRLLRRLQNVSVTGPRRIGKTSFLQYISHPDIVREHGADPEHNLFVYVDCQHDLIQGEESQVYQAMLEHIAGSARQAGVDTATRPEKGSAAGAAFESMLKELSRRGVGTILLLDEFEEMARNTHLDPGFFSNLRALCGDDDVDVAYVTSSCASLADLCLERQSLLSSPFFNIFQTIRLGLFAEQDSRYLVEDSLYAADARLPRDLVELVLEVGGGHPLFLQMAGYHAVRLSITGDGLTEGERDAFLKAVSAEAKKHFEFYWQELEEQQQYILASLPLLWKNLGYQETIEYLRDQCLIARRNDEYGYFSPLLEEFVRRQQVSGLLQAGPLLVDQRRKQVLVRGRSLDLSATDYGLLACLMQRAGQMVSNEELWQAARPGEPYDAGQLSVDIGSLRQVLGKDADCIVERKDVGHSFCPSQE